MAAERDTVALTADVATTVTLTEPFRLVEVLVTEITSASTVVIYASTTGSAAVAGADELDAVAGGIGAYNQFVARRSNCTTVSLIASENCTVIVSRVQ